MCRPKSEGGRRCPGSHSGGSSPPADGKTRIEAHTSKRSYSVIGGESNVAWMPGEKVVSMDVIDPGQSGGSAGRGGDKNPPKSSRRIDGKPETEKDKRFFDLRESGYRGPIDQDGRIPAADDPAHDILAALAKI